MRHKTYLRVLWTLIAVFALTLAATATAYAYTDPEADGSPDTSAVPSPAETAAEAEAEPEPAAEPVELTPDGQLTLVDDISGDAAQDKQFLTVITKNGNYFYIVIDRAGDTENVHFLNLVDESDLLALIEDDTAATTAAAVATPEPVEAEPADEPEPEQKPSLSAILGAIFLLALAGGGAFLYIKVLKPKRTAKAAAVPSSLDGFDFDDDGFDELGGGEDIGIMEPDGQTEPYGYEDYQEKEDGQ